MRRLVRGHASAWLITAKMSLPKIMSMKAFLRTRMLQAIFSQQELPIIIEHQMQRRW